MRTVDFVKAKLEVEKRKRGLQDLELAGLDGSISFGAKRGADLFVGRGVDALRDLVGKVYASGRDRALGFELGPFEKIRRVIRAGHIERATIRFREAQTGPGAGATFRRVRGVYKGASEHTVEMVFLFLDEEGGFTPFRSQMIELTETLAYAFAQEAIYLTFTDGERVESVGASATGLPSPGSRLETVLREARFLLQHGARTVTVYPSGRVEKRS